MILSSFFIIGMPKNDIKITVAAACTKFSGKPETKVAMMVSIVTFDDVIMWMNYMREQKDAAGGTGKDSE